LKLNGTDYPDSATEIDLQPRKAADIPNRQVITINYVAEAADGDAVQVYWSGSSTQLKVESLPAGTSPVSPAVPSIILTATQVLYTQVGPQGPQGSTGIPGAEGIPGANGDQGDQGPQGAQGNGYFVFSPSSHSLSVGSKTFIVSSPESYFDGLYVRVTSNNVPTYWMQGVITAYTSTTITVNVDTVNGSGTYESWHFSIAGVTGAQGAQGAAGTNGTNGDWSTAQTLNTQTGTSYTVLSGDVGKLITLTNGSAIALTVNTGLGLTAGQRIDLFQNGAGQVTVGGTATFRSTPTLKLRAQYSAATLICLGGDVFALVGDLAAT
jgi:hypothetical protein